MAGFLPGSAKTISLLKIAGAVAEVDEQFKECLHWHLLVAITSSTVECADSSWPIKAAVFARCSDKASVGPLQKGSNPAKEHVKLSWSPYATR